MKKPLLLLLLLVTVLFAAAQKKQIDTLRVALSKAKTDTMRYNALYNLSMQYYYNGNLDSTLISAQQAYLLAKKNNWAAAQEGCLNAMANVYGDVGDYVKAISTYFKALKIDGELNLPVNIANTNDNIGDTYMQRGDYKKALPYFHIAQKEIDSYYLSLKSDDDKQIRVAIYINFGLCYLHLDQADSAEYALNIALNDCKKYKIAYMIGGIQHGLGEVEAEKGNKAPALQFFRQSVITKKANGLNGLFENYFSIAKLYHKFKQRDSAEYYAQKVFEMASGGKDEQSILDVAKLLYTLYDEEHNLPQAYQYFKIATAAKDSLYSQDKIKQLLSVDFNERERQQQLQTTQKEAQTDAENRLRTYVLSGGLGVLLLLALIFWRNSRQRQRANTLLKAQNDEIEQQKKNVETTLGELKTTQAQLIQSHNSISVLSQIGKEITSTLNLDTILNTVYEKVNELMEANVFGIGIFIPEEQSIDYRMAIEDGRRYTPYRREMDNKNQFPVWCIENNKEVFINNVQKEYINYISEYSEVLNAKLDDGSNFKSPVSLIYLPLAVGEKVVGLITVQSFREGAYTLRHLDILKTLASYTSAALYNANSFETLQTALNELQLTQKQLIQSEKMASLGELTAGIAHEIQNPLNFVNNFSEVSIELLEELVEETKNGNNDEVMAIAGDLSQNLAKITHHGKRADGIVKGMLEHSRASNGQKEPTNINLLADEYFKLSYHGLRAKDKSFNAELITSFDEKLPLANVIPQDIGRVLLNLFNNAFYAVNQKKKTAGPGYRPTVEVTTFVPPSGGLGVAVKDNGTGIPDHIKDKIMQPFFTTKPTGEGTGLGLSLSYDAVVKGHNGKIVINTGEGQFTEFIIYLPV